MDAEMTALSEGNATRWSSPVKKASARRRDSAPAEDIVTDIIVKSATGLRGQSAGSNVSTRRKTMAVFDHDDRLRRTQARHSRLIDGFIRGVICREAARIRRPARRPGGARRSPASALLRVAK